MDGASALGAAVEKSCKHCGTNRSSLLSISSLQGKKASMAGYHYSHNSLYPRHLPNFFLLISREWDRACLVPAQGLQILFSFSLFLQFWEDENMLRSCNTKGRSKDRQSCQRDTFLVLFGTLLVTK